MKTGLLAPIFLAVAVFSSFGAVSAHFTSDFDPNFYTMLHFQPNDPPVAGEPSEMIVSAFNATTGDPITELDIVHERMMHFFIVGDDFETFFHTHVEDYPDGANESYRGVYKTGYTFPKAGFYSVIVDYTSSGKNTIRNFVVWSSEDVRGETPERNGFDPDLSRDGVFDGYSVSLAAPDQIMVGEEVALDHHIEFGGEPVRDLQNLLGSAMHVVIIKTDLSYASHTHAYVPSHFIHAGTMAQRYYGPDVPVRHTFTQPGDYAVFGQFMHDGEVVTTRFFVRVDDNFAGYVIAYGLYAAVIAFGAFVFRDELSGMIRSALRYGKGKRPKR